MGSAGRLAIGAIAFALVAIALLATWTCQGDGRPEGASRASRAGAAPRPTATDAEEVRPSAEAAPAASVAAPTSERAPAPERPYVPEEQPRPLTVRVMEADRTAVADVVVQFAGLSGNARTRGRSDAQGVLLLEAPPGAQKLDVDPHRGRYPIYATPITVPVGPQQTDVEVVLERGVPTPVRVLTPDGSPVRAVVHAWSAGEPYVGTPWGSGATDTDGRMWMLLPPRERLDVVVDSVDGSRTAGDGALRGVLASVRGLVVTCRLVPQDRTLTVRVTDADGAPFPRDPEGDPIPGTRVDLAVRSRGYWRHAETGGDGAARFEGLPALEVEVTVDKDYGALVRPRACLVVPDGQEVVLRFRRTAAIEGVVVVAPDRGVSGVQVEVRRASDNERLGAAATQEGGRFALRVPVDEAGPFRLVVDGYDARKRGEYRGALDGVRPGLGPVRVVVDEN